MNKSIKTNSYKYPIKKETLIVAPTSREVEYSVKTSEDVNLELKKNDLMEVERNDNSHK